MTKFATTATLKTKPAVGIVKTKTLTPTTVTFEGGEGFERKAKSELFLLSVVNMVGEKAFYEDASTRDDRFVSLIHKVVGKDPEWVARFIPYLRDVLGMRTAAVVMAAEYVKAGGPGGRKVIDSALLRAEEPSVLLAYWMKTYGKRLPQPVKRGVADAAIRLYNERSFIKYDSDTLTPRFGDVIELTHPKAATPWQHSLFRYAIDKRHNRDDMARNVEELSTIKRFRDLMAMPVADRRALVDRVVETGDFSELEGAGLTWEALSGWLQGPMDAKAWTAIIPQMGYMALIRNLRNFDAAGISDETRAAVIAKLTDPDEVAKSRQLPLRFLSAYKNVEGVEWSAALEKALDLTLANVPSFKGKTLVLVDVSGSMDGPFSSGGGNRQTRSGAAKHPTLWEAAAVFGAAVAVRAEKADLVAFETGSHVIDFGHGGSILRTVERFRGVPHGGTNTWQAFAQHFKDHDRVVIVTDEQAHPGQRVDTGKPVYTFNVTGYARGMAPAGENWYTFGGLTDNAFKAIVALENFKDEAWAF